MSEQNDNQPMDYLVEPLSDEDLDNVSGGNAGPVATCNTGTACSTGTIATPGSTAAPTDSK